MNESEHLTISEINGYRAGTFAEAETREIGKHLILCAVCRKKLPVLDREGFLTALNKENVAVNSPSGQKEHFPWWQFSLSFPLLSFAVLLLFLGFGLIYLIFFNDERASPDLNAQMHNQKEIIETAPPENKPEIGTTDRSQAVVRKTIAPHEEKRETPNGQKLTAPEIKNQKRPLPRKNANYTGEIESIALVRGNTNSAAQDKPDAIDAKVFISGENLKLTWSKNPSAAGYSVVVVNAESNELIDELKLKDQTEALIPVTTLGRAKKYEIRVVAVSSDGSIKTSRTFTFTKNFRKH